MSGVGAWVLVVLAGCGGLGAHPGAAGWSEISSEHFQMWTDGDLGHARETLAEMEHLRSIVLGVAFPTMDSHRRTLVVAFSDQKETSRYLPEQFAAQAQTSTPLREPIIIMAADADEKNARTLAHELTHVISFEYIRRQPPWFAEGLATFFSTVTLDPSSANVAVGEPNPDLVATIQRRQLDQLADLFACTAVPCRTSDWYATAWSLMTFLMNEHPAELTKYEQALLLVTPPPAWSDVVPELPTAELQHQLGMWLIRGRHTVWRYKLSVHAWPTTSRKLPEADVHAIEGMILARLHPDEGRAELATALQLDPTNLVANLVVAARDWGRLPLPAARALAAAHGEDWRAWRVLGLALDAAHDPEVGAARARMCELLAKDPHADPPAGLSCSTVPRP